MSTTKANAQPKSNLKYNLLMTLAALVIGIVLKLVIPPVHGLTEVGVTLIAIFVPTIFLYIFVDTLWSSILALCMLCFCRIDSPNAIWTYAWAGNTIIPYFIPTFMVCGVMSSCGAMEWIAKWFVSRKIVEGRPYMFLAMLFLCMTILGFVASPTAMLIVMSALVHSVATSMGDDKKHGGFYWSAMYSTGLVAQSQDSVRPFSKPILAALLGILAGFGYDYVNAATYLVYAFPYALIIIVSMLVVLKFVVKPDFSVFKNYNAAEYRQWLKDNPMTRRGKLCLIGLVAILVMWLLPFVNFLPTLKAFFTGQTTAAVCIVMVILCLLPAEDGKPVMDMKAAFKFVPWNVLVMIGTILVLSSYFGKADFGVAKCFGALLAPLVEGMSPFALIAIALLIVVVLTNIISNMVTAVVVGTVFTAALVAMDASAGLIIAFVMSVNAVSNMAFCTMAASAIQPMIFNDGTIPIKGSVKYSVVYCLLTTVLAIPLTYLIANIL